MHDLALMAWHEVIKRRLHIEVVTFHATAAYVEGGRREGRS